MEVIFTPEAVEDIKVAGIAVMLSSGGLPTKLLDKKNEAITFWKLSIEKNHHGN
jgi:hypothetical protein